MKRSIKAGLGVVVLALALVVVFQNCSAPVGSESKQTSMSSRLPFAYDASIDTLGYMSCAGGDTAANPAAIWSFRAGAFGANAGLRLRQNYLDLTRNFTPAQRGAILAEGGVNAKTGLQFAIRQSTAMQSPLSSSGSGYNYGVDYSFLLAPLDRTEVAARVAALDSASTARVNYFPGISGATGRGIEGAMRFTASEGVANSVRGFLANSSLLTVTYSEGASVNARGPDGLSETSVYGRGYRVQFTYGAPEAATGVRTPIENFARVVSSVQELDLETGRAPLDAVPWTCPAELQFRVVRACGAACPCGVDNGNADLFARARRVLKVEHWYVNMANRCVVQKVAASQCYSTDSTTPGNFHFVSVCTRN